MLCIVQHKPSLILFLWLKFMPWLHGRKACTYTCSFLLYLVFFHAPLFPPCQQACWKEALDQAGA